MSLYSAGHCKKAKDSDKTIQNFGQVMFSVGTCSRAHCCISVPYNELDRTSCNHLGCCGHVNRNCSSSPSFSSLWKSVFDLHLPVFQRLKGYCFLFLNHFSHDSFKNLKSFSFCMFAVGDLIHWRNRLKWCHVKNLF